MSENLSRRAFLKLAGASGMVAFLAACAPKAAEPTAAPQPAGTTAPEATAVPPTAAPPASAGTKKMIFSSYTWSGYEAAMRSVIEAWNKEHPEVAMEGQYIPEDYWTKVQTQVAGGTPPDVGIADYGRLLSYAKSDTLLPITELISRDSFPIDKMIPGAVAQYRWRKGDFNVGGEGGDMWGLPSDAQDQIFAYNKKMFDDAGVKYPTDDWTWDDLVTAGKAITKADQNKWGMLMVPTYILAKGNFVWSAGGNIHTEDLKKSMLDAPETIEAYKWNWDLIYTHKIAPTPGAQAQTNPFMSGQVAMFVEGVWWISDFVTGITDFDWDVALLPKHPKTGKRTVSVESDGWWVFKGTKETELSWSLLQYLSNEAGQKRFGEMNYVIPSCFPEVAKEWYSKKPPENRMKALDNIVQDSAKVDFGYYESMAMLDAFGPIIDKAFADGEDVVVALKEAAKVHNEELDKAWGTFAAS